MEKTCSAAEMEQRRAGSLLKHAENGRRAAAMEAEKELENVYWWEEEEDEESGAAAKTRTCRDKKTNRERESELLL